MKQITQYIYYAMIIFGFCLILLCGYFTLDGTQAVDMVATEPYNVEQLSDSEKNYYFNMNKMTDYALDVVFFSHHQFVKVFADGKEIYSQVKDGGIWGHTNGSIWNFVTIPYGTQELRIQYVSAYEAVQDEEHEFYFGDKLEIYKAILKKSLLPMLVSVILVVIGIAMSIYGIVVNRKANTGRSLQYLGMFIFILGLWSFNETDAVTVMINHRITSAFSAYIFLMMLCPAFILFSREFICIEDDLIWKILCNAGVLISVVCVVLQFADILDFKESVIAIHIIMVIDISYVIMALIHKMYKGRITKNMRTNLTSLVVLITAVIIDLVFYYIGTFDADLFGRFVFLVFAIILGKASLDNTVQVIEEGKKAKFYEELAITDALTGLYNRNAYEMDIVEMEKKTGVLIVSFDLNNLKDCNDSLGHSEGDNYIKTAAGIIRNVFSAYGKCYRIGGDEFITIIEKGRKCPVEELIKRLIHDEEQCNKKAMVKFPIHIASGYSLYEGGANETIKMACGKADEMMYKEKRLYKESH